MMARKVRRTGITAMRICLTALSIVTLFSLESCKPTYPRGKLTETVKKVCKSEYNMDVDVTVVGSTMGLYYKMNGLLDPSLQISRKSWDTISDLVSIASRVALSTDADIKFYCVITQDTRLPELQVVIIKYVEDIKRSIYNNISRTESFKRTLFSINLTPQAKKERSIEKIFNKMNVEQDIRQNILNDFFRSSPTRLSDIGYWKDKFYLKNITIQEFLAAQIANRIKIEFRTDKDLKDKFRFISSEGIFTTNQGVNVIIIRFKIDDLVSPGKTPEEMRAKKVAKMLSIANHVVSGYEFKNFDILILEDQLENTVLTVKSPDVIDYGKKHMPVKEIVDAPKGYF